MSSLTSFFDGNFNTQREEWEKALLAELKLPEVGNKATKKLLNGMNWPTLFLNRKSEVQLAPVVEWKKSSTTYAYLSESELAHHLQDDLKSGVRNFFFEDGALVAKTWDAVEAELKKHSPVSEIEVIFTGKDSFESKNLKVISQLVTGREAHDQGGNSVQELGFLAKNLTQNLKDGMSIGVYVDSHFFHNIAKIRAARLLALKIIEESGKKCDLKVVALTSYQGWTLFERYSNMLRNETAVASAYIGGADHVQSAGYNTLIELETEFNGDQEHSERSQRMARNTSHILGLESMLGVVQDAAFGSYHLENLTQMLCEESWKLMQRLLKGEDLTTEILSVREQKLQMMKTRKTVMSGINDYPDVKEELHLKLKPSKVWRPARAFEELRLRMEHSKRPEAYIALYGDYGALNARLNFVKNYFELLGLTVHEPGHSELDAVNFRKTIAERKEDIIVLCAADENYHVIADAAVKAPHKFIAGKFELAGYKNLFAGQNVYEVLQNLVEAYSGGVK